MRALDLWPAIDIRGGRCVRLLQGDFSKSTTYGDPVEVADAYVQAGAPRLHVVDLDAALKGEPSNREVVGELIRRVDVPVQVGGGVRDEAAASVLFGLGAARVVVGTAAVEDPDLLELLAGRWPGRVVAGLDYRWLDSGTQEVAVRGWTESSGRRLEDVLATLEHLDLAGVVATDISRDGMGTGPDIKGLRRVLDVSGLKLVASGGVSSLGDLHLLRSVFASARRIDGAIVGKALLSGAFSVAEALAACQ